MRETVSVTEIDAASARCHASTRWVHRIEPRGEPGAASPWECHMVNLASLTVKVSNFSHNTTVPKPTMF